MTNLTAGKRFFSTQSAVEVIIVKGAEGELLCAGAPMVLAREGAAPTDTGNDIAMGKRYLDEASGLIVLATKGGSGPLTFAGRDLAQQATAALPSSD